MSGISKEKHDFFGTKIITKSRPDFSNFGEDLATEYATELTKQQNQLTQFTQEIWPTLPLETQVKPGDSILCASDGKPDIIIWSKDLENNPVPCTVAYPVTVETVIKNKGGQEIIGVTYLADVLNGDPEARKKFIQSLPKDTTENLKQLKQALAEAGFLEKETVTVKPADFRLLTTVQQHYPGKLTIQE